MQLYAQQTEIRRSEYRIMDDDGNFINVVQLEIGGLTAVTSGIMPSGSSGSSLPWDSSYLPPLKS